MAPCAGAPQQFQGHALGPAAPLSIARGLKAAWPDVQTISPTGRRRARAPSTPHRVCRGLKRRALQTSSLTLGHGPLAAPVARPLGRAGPVRAPPRCHRNCGRPLTSCASPTARPCVDATPTASVAESIAPRSTTPAGRRIAVRPRRQPPSPATAAGRLRRPRSRFLSTRAARWLAPGPRRSSASAQSDLTWSSTSSQRTSSSGLADWWNPLARRARHPGAHPRSAKWVPPTRRWSTFSRGLLAALSRSLSAQLGTRCARTSVAKTGPSGCLGSVALCAVRRTIKRGFDSVSESLGLLPRVSMPTWCSPERAPRRPERVREWFRGPGRLARDARQARRSRFAVAVSGSAAALRERPTSGAGDVPKARSCRPRRGRKLLIRVGAQVGAAPLRTPALSHPFWGNCSAARVGVGLQMKKCSSSRPAGRPRSHSLRDARVPERIITNGCGSINARRRPRDRHPPHRQHGSIMRGSPRPSSQRLRSVPPTPPRPQTSVPLRASSAPRKSSAPRRSILNPSRAWVMAVGGQR